MQNTHTIGFVRFVPNIISFIRIFGALLLPAIMMAGWETDIVLPVFGEVSSVPLAWILIFLVLVVSDKLDGTLARNLNVVSGLGAILDVIGDALLLVVGVMSCVVGFARGSLTDIQFVICVLIVISLLAEKFLVFLVSKKYFGKGNMLHSFFHKAFAATAYVFIPFWALFNTMPMWSIGFLWVMMTYAIVDEIVYIVRTAEYDFDFKGHGFQKYPLRKK